MADREGFVQSKEPPLIIKELRNQKIGLCHTNVLQFFIVPGGDSKHFPGRWNEIDPAPQKKILTSQAASCFRSLRPARI